MLFTFSGRNNCPTISFNIFIEQLLHIVSTLELRQVIFFILSNFSSIGIEKLPKK